MQTQCNQYWYWLSRLTRFQVDDVGLYIVCNCLLFVWNSFRSKMTRLCMYITLIVSMHVHACKHWPEACLRLIPGRRFNINFLVLGRSIAGRMSYVEICRRECRVGLVCQHKKDQFKFNKHQVAWNKTLSESQCDLIRFIQDKTQSMNKPHSS